MKFISPLKLAIINFFQKNLVKGTFSEFLRSSSASIADSDGMSLSYHYVVPPELCRVDNDNKPYFSAGAIIALFDDLSSYCFMVKDKNSRPGVSVNLFAEVFTDSHSKDNLKMICNPIKIGKSLGFCNMELYDANLNLVARGSHIKYLPAGLAFDILMNPICLPFTVATINAVTSLPFVKNKLNSKATIQDKVNLSDLIVMKSLNTSASVTSNTYTFNAAMKSELRNANGVMHGGATAMIVEHAALLAAAGNYILLRLLCLFACIDNALIFTLLRVMKFMV